MKKLLCVILISAMLISVSGMVLAEGESTVDLSATEWTPMEDIENAGVFMSNYKYGVCDSSGNVILPAEYEMIDTYYSYYGRVLFKKDGKYGFFNTDFEVVIPAIYNQADSFFEGISRVSDDKMYYIDPDGKLSSPKGADVFLIDSRNGRASFVVDNKYGAYDLVNHTDITEYKYDELMLADDCIYLGTSAGIDKYKYEKLDSQGALSAVPISDFISAVDEAGRIVTRSFKKVNVDIVGMNDAVQGDLALYALYDSSFEPLFPAIAEEPSSMYETNVFHFRDGLCAIKTNSTSFESYNDNPRYGFFGNGKFALINEKGEYVSDKDYDEISLIGGKFFGSRGNNFYLLAENSAAPANKDTIMKISDWAQADVDTAMSYGIVPEELEICMTENITRRQFCLLAVTMYEQLKGALPTPKSRPFTDTDEETVIKAYTLGVVDGYGDGVFAPDKEITRQEAACLLDRLSNVISGEAIASEELYADDAQIGDWAKPHVYACKTVGIMGGVGDNRFNPTGKYTIEQSVITVYRIFSTKG